MLQMPKVEYSNEPGCSLLEGVVYVLSAALDAPVTNLTSSLKDLHPEMAKKNKQIAN